MGIWEMIMGEQPGPIESLMNFGDTGHYGEFLTEYALNNDNVNGYLKTFMNLYIPYRGRTTEIDLIMIHEKGLFVFESKNYSGWIFGDADKQKWTQCLPNKQKHQFYNPIMQNRTHIKALSDFLGLPVGAFSSYIIFSERCELKKVPENSEAYTILKRNRMLRHLRAVLSERPSIYSHEQVDAFVNKLGGLGKADSEQKAQHVEDIKLRTQGDICPFCGSKLVERNSKYGAFYGCSSFPKCRFTRKIT